jgi:hypothetical protein
VSCSDGKRPHGDRSDALIGLAGMRGKPEAGNMPGQYIMPPKKMNRSNNCIGEPSRTAHSVHA